VKALKKLFLSLATIVSVLTLSTAKAGAMGPVEQPFSWTGFYLGANAGYGWGHHSSQLVIPGNSASLDFYLPGLAAGAYDSRIGYHQNGFIGGGQIGYNYQFNRALIGIETDFNGADIKDNQDVKISNANTNLFVPWTGSAGARLEWLGTVRGRLGFTPWQQALLYATGGFAYGDVKHSYKNAFAQNNNFFHSSRSRITTGYTVGGGGEWMFTGHWSAKIEYLYYYLGKSTDFTTPGGRSVTAVAGGIRPLGNVFRDSGNIVRIGVNYRC
jgi:outer membrane immunogenic protein